MIRQEKHLALGQEHGTSQWKQLALDAGTIKAQTWGGREGEGGMEYSIKPSLLGERTKKPPSFSFCFSPSWGMQTWNPLQRRHRNRARMQNWRVGEGWLTPKGKGVNLSRLTPE
jgi:hypothetical protein